MEKRVLIVQPVLAHYRESLFKLMVEDASVDFHIGAGENLNKIKEFDSGKYEKIDNCLTNKEIKIGNRKFYFQKGIYRKIKEIKPTNIIFGGPDFNYISTILISFYVLWFTKIKLHYWTHGLSKNKTFLVKLITKYLYENAESIFTYEKEGKNKIIEVHKINSSKIYIVKNCLNTWDYGFNRESKIKNANKRLEILFSGRITYEKRVDILFDALKVLKKESIIVGCTVVGDGEYLGHLKNLAIQLRIDKQITFAGAVYGEQINKYFHNADVFVLPGKVGLSIVHALSYGLPVITTSMPIHSPEFAILKDGYNAFLFNTQKAKNLADVIKTYGDKNNKQKYNENAINSIYEHGYIPEAMKENFIKGLIKG